MKHFSSILAVFATFFMLGMTPSTSAKEPDRQVVFKTTLTCQNCAKKITENISFEKGVKDLEVSVPEKTVRVVYTPSKTSVETLAKAINKLGYKTEVIASGEASSKAQKTASDKK